MSKCRCGIGLCNVDDANVFEVFLGAGLKLYKYESRVFQFTLNFRILPFEICEVLSSKSDYVSSRFSNPNVAKSKSCEHMTLLCIWVFANQPSG